MSVFLVLNERTIDTGRSPKSNKNAQQIIVERGSPSHQLYGLCNTSTRLVSTSLRLFQKFKGDIKKENCQFVCTINTAEPLVTAVKKVTGTSRKKARMAFALRLTVRDSSKLSTVDPRIVCLGD